MNEFERIVTNAYLSRADLHAKLFDGRYKTRDIDAECGYPESIGIDDYIKMYTRNDVAARVVDVEPNECWKEYPEVYETEEERETVFEKALDKLVSETKLYVYLARADRISGIGRYGVLFIGLDDGKEFRYPAPGFGERAPLEEPGDAKVLYYRVFDESSISINKYENDVKNPRYGLPLYYDLTFQDFFSSDMVNAVPETKIMTVHWSRCIHIADGLHTSEVFGTPRMENVYNRLYDLRKINGGAGEMFWKGGFPGYSFQVDPKNGELTQEDRDAIKAEIKQWEEGLSRSMASVGVDVKSLAPQIADPRPTVDNCLKIIATTKGIPMRLLTGAEAGHLASTQDSETWTERVALRRNMYITPYLIRPTIERMQQYGALPMTEVVEGSPKAFTVQWRPLAALTETEKAKVALDRTEALARYATSGGEALVPLTEFLTKFLKLSFQEAEAITKAAPTSLSLVFKEIGMSGAAGGNVPTSVPNMSKSKDPSKTPVNKVQPAKKKTSPTTPPTVQND